MWKTKLKFATLGILLGAALVFYYKESNVISVDKITHRDRVVTRIVERPGEKITEIIKDSQKSEEHLSSKSRKKDWTVGVTYSPNIGQQLPIYGIQVSRRIIFDLSVGAFVNTQTDYGLILSYSF